MKPIASEALDSIIPFNEDSIALPPTGISSGDEHFDHFQIKNGIEYAGTHLIIDLWDASRLDDLELMESAMREAVLTCGATLLHIHLHHFTPTYGISGVAILAESHISVHTWPERNFAAFDIFMCGEAKPELAIPVLKQAFEPEKMNISEHLRGMNDSLSI
jgi:S-adenosylmethionine decarboxylase